jgi:PP-loop superfamily ATP-utilizing enzyme
MTHKEIAKELAGQVAGTFDFETLLQTAYEVLKEEYEDSTEQELLEKVEEHKEYLGTTQVDDLLSAARKNVALLEDWYKVEV